MLSYYPNNANNSPRKYQRDASLTTHLTNQRLVHLRNMLKYQLKINS